MKTTTAFVPIGEVINDAAAPLRDEGFHRLGKPFYVAAGFRGLRKLCFDTNFNKRAWSAVIPENLLLDLPAGVIELDGAWLFNGDRCDINTSAVLFIKDNMHRTGGNGYFANNKWVNRDPMQFSYGWSCAPPSNLYFAGSFNKQLHLSDSCLQYCNVHLLYTASVDQCEDDFDVPEWAADALTDYITLRGAEALEREDPQFLRGMIARKENEMKAPNGSWREAQWYYKRMDKKARYDIAAKLFRLGHTP